LEDDAEALDQHGITDGSVLGLVLVDAATAIQRLHETLGACRSKSEFSEVLDRVCGEGIVVPMSWMESQHKDGLSSQSISRQQIGKDLQRDQVTVDGFLLDNPRLDDLTAVIAHRIAEAFTADARDDNFIGSLASEIAMCCSRTALGSDLLNTVLLLFGHGWKNHGHTVVMRSADFSPVTVDIFQGRSDKSTALPSPSHAENRSCSVELKSCFCLIDEDSFFDTLYNLNCQYVKFVHWSGLAQSGHFVINISSVAG